MATRGQDDYLRVGLALLAKGGADSVTIANLCTRLHVTKGSFYHHFAGRGDFIRRLLRYWEREHGARLGARLLLVSDLRQRVALLQKAALLEQATDGAIRQLARSDKHAAAVQRRVERWREAMLARTFREMGMPALRASRLAGIGLAIAAGTQQPERPIGKRRFAGLVAEYRRWVDASARRR
ncbi:MAG TPA: helix-turn-helix domain-containing protein [Myxococcota bacterium]|nr:helix-turn-helix domain-containing protein [Myxococcota bacterium]